MISSRYVAVALTALVFLTSSSAFAFDFLEFASRSVLICAHPTANPDKAEAFYIDEPKAEGEKEKAKVKVGYQGWIFSNEMTMNIWVDKEKRAHIEILSDTNRTGIRDCKYERGYHY
jgi:hypothetical protein